MRQVGGQRGDPGMATATHGCHLTCAPPDSSWLIILTC